MKVAGLIYSPKQASSRIRIIQYTDEMSLHGVKLETKFFRPYKDQEARPFVKQVFNKSGIGYNRIDAIRKTLSRLPFVLQSKKFNIIWQNRLLVLFENSWEKKIKKPFVFDFDDAIWMTEGEKQVSKRISESTMVFAGNSFLADFAKKNNPNTVIIPSVINTNRNFPLPKNTKKLIIGWIGTKFNFQYLEYIKQPLLEFLKNNPTAQLKIISSEPPSFLPFDNNHVVFKQWNADEENEDINSFSIGIMPLLKTEWEMGKCGFKLLQYLACGVPAIATPTGVNEYICNMNNSIIAATSVDEWGEALNQLANNLLEYNRMAADGVTFITENYSCAVWAPKIIKQFKKVC